MDTEGHSREGRRDRHGGPRAADAGTARDLRPPRGPDGTPNVAVDLPEELPVALVYDEVTHAVMMATPRDLVDYAVGFTWTEGVSRSILEVELHRHVIGLECRMRLPPDAPGSKRRMRRRQTGLSGCGLCGVASLAQAVRLPEPVAAGGCRIAAAEIASMQQALRLQPRRHSSTLGLHAAGWYRPGQGLVMHREDVGRHNALDKLAGALLRAGEDTRAGALVLSSRVSIEMVQKSAAIGVTVLVAAATPTALAVRMAHGAGITLVGRARGAGHVVYTHPERLDARSDATGYRT